MRIPSILTLVAATAAASCSPDVEGVDAGRTEEEAAVLQVVERFFETMTSKDAVVAAEVLDP